MAMRPPSSGTSPASARSSVVFPAPLGPRTATVSLSTAWRSTSRSSSPSWTSTAASRLTNGSEPPISQEHEHDDRDREEQEAQDDRGALLCFEKEVHGERHGLGSALNVARERDGGAELAERTGPRERGPGEQRRRDERERDAP